MSLREAAGKALDALCDAASLMEHRHLNPKRQNRAIEALREALAEPVASASETLVEQIAEAKRDMAQWPQWMQDAAHVSAAVAHPPAALPELSDEEIISIRDDHLPNQGESFDCVLFARAVLAAAKRTPCGECHLSPGERCDICGAKLS